MEHQNKKIFVFTDSDLDGIGCLLSIMWYFGKENVEYKFTTVTNIKRDITEWSKTHDVDDYFTVYICDLDCQSCLDIVDRMSVVIIDHHKTHYEVRDIYKNATVIITNNYTIAATKLVYKYFIAKSSAFSISKEKMMLLSLINDYDTYTLAFKNSMKLNWLYWGYIEGKRAERLLNEFYEGFNGFTDTQKNIIQNYEYRLNKTKEECSIFEKNTKIGDEQVNIKLTSSSSFINDICQWLIEYHNADIAININIERGQASFRKSKKCKVDLSKLAEKLCGGGGHESSAGGKLTDLFADFVKTFKEVS